MYFLTSSIIQGSIRSPAIAMGDLPPAAVAIAPYFPQGAIAARLILCGLC